MKARLVIGTLVILCVLSSVLSGCTRNGGESESIYSEDSSNASNSSDIIGNIDDSSDSSNSSDYGDCSVKTFSKIIDSEGTVLENTEQVRDLFLLSMDNDYFYFDHDVFPVIISSIDKNDFSQSDFMTYDMNIEAGNGNKFTYCGSVFTFPCYGNPYSDVYMRAFVGKVGEPCKCVFYRQISKINAYPAELNDTEMIFMCICKEEGEEVYEIYKYKIGDEQAKLIRTEKRTGDGQGLVTCYNGEIYFICGCESKTTSVDFSNRDEKLLCIKS